MDRHTPLPKLKAIANTTGYPPQHNGKALLLKTLLAYIIKHVKIYLIPN